MADEAAREMAARGVGWYGDARAALIPLIGPNGARMADVLRHSGLTRQAVHQLAAALEADGILRRAPDPDDARGGVQLFTEAGNRVLALSKDAKRAIDADYRARIGAQRLTDLAAALDQIAREACEKGVKTRRRR